MNPDPELAEDYGVGVTLLTRDGSRIGNAIIFAVEDVANRPRFHIETDFGNRTKMFAEELNELFSLGYVVGHDEWRGDRLEVQRKYIEEDYSE